MCKSRYVLKYTKDKNKHYVYILKSNQCGKIDFVPYRSVNSVDITEY